VNQIWGGWPQNDFSKNFPALERAGREIEKDLKVG
jgi:hypothetical protein